MTQSRLGRLWTIYRVAQRYQLRALLKPETDTDSRPRGERLRKALEDLGPVFVKLGQALSTRPDLLPSDIASELTKLQDRVPPFSSQQAMAVIERELGKPVEQLFQSFDAEPLASASVAQVHTATLKPTGPDDPGFPVIVKVLRPGIRAVIESDLRVLHTLADLIARHTDIGRRVKPREVVAEFEKIILDELDLMREGANASQLRRNWLGSPAIYHPLVFWDFTRPQVLVMERIFGISIRELDRLRAMDVDFEVLAARGVEIFFKQTFRDNFFHADMHPGNIFVDASDPARPSYQAVDFGIVGSLTPDDQRYLAENFLAFFNRDYRRIAELHLESEWIPGETRVEEFEAAIRTVCEPIFQRPLKDISFGFFLLRLFEVARRFDYQVQPQLVLLQKTLLNIEGLGRQLYPELDLWKTAKPILEDWMRRRLGPRQALEHLRSDLPLLSEQVPVVARRLLRQLAAGHGVDGGAQLRELRALRLELRQQRRSQLLTLIGAVAVIAALGFAATATPSGSLAQGWSTPSWLLLVTGAAAWFSALRGR